MRINELVRVLVGLLLLASSMECGRSDHIHLKIHVPNVHHRHKHVKTKYIHVFHPQVIHSDHASYQFVHSRKDPNVGLINGGFSQPLIKVNKNNPELRITEEEFNKWRQDQMTKAYEQRMRLYEAETKQKEAEDENEDEDEEDTNEAKKEEFETEEEELYKKHKANKANSSTSRKEGSKHKNHNYNRNQENYNQDFEASNADKTYANYSNPPKSKKKPFKPSPAVHQTNERPRKKPQTSHPANYGYVNHHQGQASNLQPIYNMDPTAVDPSYYSTIPKDQMAAGSDSQDDIYSGLLSSRYTKSTADKSKFLADINYIRKQQAKTVVAKSRKSQ